MKCPKCLKYTFGEMQTFCKHCLHTYDEGGDRWFSHRDEETPIKEVE